MTRRLHSTPQTDALRVRYRPRIAGLPHFQSMNAFSGHPKTLKIWDIYKDNFQLVDLANTAKAY